MGLVNCVACNSGITNEWLPPSLQVESPWTIRKLSGTLCWLETYGSFQEVLVSFGRRVLCYPLHRHFALVSAALRDTTKIFQSGRACVLKCLLDIHRVFRENEPAYILNDLYIIDYCIWIQRVKSKKVAAFSAMLQKASLRKKDLELELEELEEAAAMVAEDEEEENEAEEQGAPKGAPTSRGDSSGASSDSSSSGSSDESEESEAEGQGCTDSSRRGGGGGGETSKDNPPLPQPTSAASPIPQEPTSTLLSAERKVDALPAASESTRQLIEELGERVAEELNVSQGSSCKAERSRSQLSSTEAKTEATSVRSSGGTVLELSPRRNPLLIVQTQDHPDDSGFIS
nr:PREDICTED: protein SHQ1 homolog [Paralichthys olivaceus]